MTEENEKLPQVDQATAVRLLEKAKQSFCLAIELYNRPHLANKIKACSMLLANAWELLLKSYLIKRHGLGKIYYPNSQRSLSLEDCVSKVLTNQHDPVVMNLRVITGLRNASTHFLVEEYEILYGPVLQGNVTAFAEKLKSLHCESTDDFLPQRSLALPVTGEVINREAILEKYDKATAEVLLKDFEMIQNLAAKDTTGKFAHFYEVEIRVVKGNSGNDLTLRFDKDATNSGVVLKQLQDPNDKYPLTYSDVLRKIKTKLRNENIRCYCKGAEVEFNRSHLENVAKAQGLKGNERYSVDRSAPSDANSRYTYSQHVVELVVDCLRKNPHGFLDSCRQHVQELAAQRNEQE